MRLLLDTHAFLWFVLDDLRLSPRARRGVEDAGTDVLISPASYWEIAIKISLVKYSLAVPYAEFWRHGITSNAFGVLPIDIRHTAALLDMPYQGHTDPFDRLLAAQALVEDIPLVSADGRLERYGIQRIW